MSKADAMILAYARQQKALTGDLKKKIEGVWGLLDIDNLDITYPAFEAAVMKTIQTNAYAQYTLESVFFRAYVAEVYDLDVTFQKSFYDYLTPEQSVALRKSIHSVSVAPIKTATANGVSKDYASAKALEMTKGSAMRHSLEITRQATIEKARNNPQLGYWSRRVVGETCTFCAMLEGRGAVYKADTSRFAAHDGCDCVAVPSNGGQEADVMAYKVSARNKKLTDADRERLHAYMDEYK